MTKFRMIWKVFLIGTVLILCGHISQAGQKENTGISQYVEFLKTVKKNSIQYVLDLFNDYDIVILCERDHREMTQYDFIFDLIRHPGFVDRVGHVFTEVGSKSQEKRIQSFLKAGKLHPAVLENHLLDIYRNLMWFTLWNKTNSYDFLKNLHILNQRLPADKKIRLHPSDISFDWSTATPESLEKFFQTEIPKRDQLMAQNIIEGIKALRKTDPLRRKALVIMNYRHAYNDHFTKQGQKVDNTGRFLFEAFPGKVANVLINTLRPDAKINGKEKSTVIQQGKWDAAFSLLGRQNAGFDFANTPFGNDHMDHWPHFPHSFKYQDIFTGFVFFQPIERHKIVTGVPGIFNDEFTKEFEHRYSLWMKEPIDKAALSKIMSDLEALNERRYDDLSEHLMNIRKWNP